MLGLVEGNIYIVESRYLPEELKAELKNAYIEDAQMIPILDRVLSEIHEGETVVFENAHVFSKRGQNRIMECTRDKNIKTVLCLVQAEGHEICNELNEMAIKL